jgi:hypothetical protein
LYTEAAAGVAADRIRRLASADAQAVDVTACAAIVQARFTAWVVTHGMRPPECPHDPLYQAMAAWNLTTRILLCPACTADEAGMRASLQDGPDPDACEVCGCALAEGDQVVRGSMVLPSRIGSASGRVLAAIVLYFAVCMACGLGGDR